VSVHVFFAYEIEGELGAVDFDVLPAQCSQPVRVIVSGVTLISDAKQTAIEQTHDTGSYSVCRDGGMRWLQVHNDLMA